MKHLWSSLALTLLGLSAPALAQDLGPCPGIHGPGCQPAGTIFVDDEQDDDALLKEVEGLLNDALLVDEAGGIVFREELKGMIPPDAMARAQMMLGALVHVNEQGRIVFKDPETVRPYLPMIRGFLDQGGLQRLRELQKLPPEERREALRKMMEEQQGGGGGGGGMPNPFSRPPAPAPAPRAEPAPAPRTTPAPAPRANPAPREEHGRSERDRSHGAGPAPRSGQAEGGSVEERLARIERALERIEGKLDREERRAPRARRQGLLERLFGGERERERSGGVQRMDFGRRLRALVRGLTKLAQLMGPEDVQRLGRAMGRLRENVSPEDLRDTGKMMEKAQAALDPEDLARFMEIFSDFLSSDEGREFVSEVEGMVGRLEELMNSPQGDRLGKSLEQLGGGELRERLERLIQGRDRRDEGHAPEERRSARRHEQRDGSQPLPQGPKPGSRPY